ncbi:uncharacterized protein LOC110983153 [Acanthaster planci]|uniref:Uncharacterized protein LOC110983153 n=1 Tax=Acanthaster planci TaxID=133434 RepID=A0A8B7Z3A4_ACAPL|nr:uncharacterized protein LOC110983153 [Acanthaster planci]
MRVLLLATVFGFVLAGAFSALVSNEEHTLTVEEEEMLVNLLEADLSTKSTREVATMMLSNQGLGSRQASGDCTTDSTSARCCGRVKFAGKLDVDACVLVEFSLEDLSVHLKLTILGHDVIDQTVSVHDPPAICASIPDVPFMKICVKLSDLEVNGDQFHGCIALSAKFFGKTVVTVPLGCVNIG